MAPMMTTTTTIAIRSITPPWAPAAARAARPEADRTAARPRRRGADTSRAGPRTWPRARPRLQSPRRRSGRAGSCGRGLGLLRGLRLLRHGELRALLGLL